MPINFLQNPTPALILNPKGFYFPFEFVNQYLNELLHNITLECKASKPTMSKWQVILFNGGILDVSGTLLIANITPTYL